MYVYYLLSEYTLKRSKQIKSIRIESKAHILSFFLVVTLKKKKNLNHSNTTVVCILKLASLLASNAVHCSFGSSTQLDGNSMIAEMIQDQQESHTMELCHVGKDLLQLLLLHNKYRVQLHSRI